MAKTILSWSDYAIKDTVGKEGDMLIDLSSDTTYKWEDGFWKRQDGVSCKLATKVVEQELTEAPIEIIKESEPLKVEDNVIKVVKAEAPKKAEPKKTEKVTPKKSTKTVNEK